MRALAEAGKHDAAMAVVKYHLSVTEAGEPVALQAAREADPGLERSCMTYVEKLRAEGRAEGETRGEAKALLKQITLKFGEPGEEIVARLESASPEELDRWVARILTVNSLEELFAD